MSSIDVGPQKKTYNLFYNPARKYVGSYYAIRASGGFSIYSDSYTVSLTPISSIGKYEMTDAVQILLNADVLNAKLGKFYWHRNEWEHHTLSLGPEILLGLTESNILSLGSFFEIYDDYLAHVNDACPNRFRGAHLFKADCQTEILSMDPANFIRLLQSQRIVDMGAISALSGAIYLSDIPGMLANMNRHNIFGNRPTPMLDAGFMTGDVIYLQSGIELSLDTTLSLDMGMLQILQMELGASAKGSTVDLSKTYTIPLVIRLI